MLIENHQDFGSDELAEFCETTRGLGICLDTGNTYPVAEAPLDFVRRVAPHVRHVHLKDYRVQFTDEGYRLVRCAIGAGAVPMAAMLDILAGQGRKLNAVLEPGALAFAACLAAARVNQLADDADYRTSWERGEDAAIADYELKMIRRSASNMRAVGLGRNIGDQGMTKEFAGKIAFVTGSGRGLGRVMAERLAELGADVAIHDLSWTRAGQVWRGDRPRRCRQGARQAPRKSRGGERQYRRQGGGRENEGRD